MHDMMQVYPEADDWEILFDCAAGYGLGGSTVAMFGRVGGGIYTKAADVGADLCGKARDLPQMSAGTIVLVVFLKHFIIIWILSGLKELLHRTFKLHQRLFL